MIHGASQLKMCIWLLACWGIVNDKFAPQILMQSQTLHLSTLFRSCSTLVSALATDQAVKRARINPGQIFSFATQNSSKLCLYFDVLIKDHTILNSG